MIVALDKDLNRIHIEDAVAKQECYCPYCGDRLFQRKGEVRRHHFAHMPGKVCKDTWEATYDMSDWHYDWQNSFPKANQEVLLSMGEIKHRADVLIGRTVTEFQHSNMAAKAFSDRNSFYFNLGYKVVWVFDLREHFASGRLQCDSDGKTFHWTKPRNTFNIFEIQTGQAELFFQLTDTEDNCLVKVSKVSPFGFEEFAVSEWYGKTELLSYLGVRDGVCAEPEREDISENEEYRVFCEKYHIALNKQQERAMQAIEGANLLLAVPGSGKTTVLVSRLGYMILCKNIDPNNILAMTFSKQAAKDMHSRFCKVFGERLGTTVEFRTIHSVALEIVNRYAQLSGRPAPRLESDNAKLVTDILREMQDEYPSESEIAEACAAITYIKNMSLAPEEIPEQDFSTPKMDEIYEKYQQILKTSRRMDFDDQVVFALQILKAKPRILAEYRSRFPYICVDEAQDTSKSQHELIQMLVGDQGNVFMVGDEDQSIYRFRGAFPQALMDFKDTYPNPHILWMETNYRSTPEIVNIAADFIQRNQNRYPKSMVANRENGEPVKRIEVASRTKQYAHILEVAKTLPADTAVIYRDNDSAIPLIDLFDRKGVPYRCPKREFRFFTHKIVQDVVAFMKFQQNPKDVWAFNRICYKGGFYFDKKTVGIATQIVMKRQVSFLEALTFQSERYSKIKDRVEKFAEYCKDTAALHALDFLRYLDGAGYGKHMRKENMDRNKFDLLMALADENPTVPDFLARLEELKTITADAKEEGNKGIILTTAHASKGLEYDTVYLMDVYDGQFPCASLWETDGRKSDMDVTQEERRLFYVALTRAKNHLYALQIKGKPSSFIDEILPPPEPQKPKQTERPRYSLNQFQKEFEQRQKQQEDAKRKAAMAVQAALEKAAADRYSKGYEEVRCKDFQTEDIIEDSLGVRWLKCEFCGEIKQKNEFSLLGIRRWLSMGWCTDCVRHRGN